MGYNNSHTFFEIDQSGKKLKLKDTYYFNGTTVKDGAGNSTAIANLGEIKLNVLGGQTTPGNDSNHGDTIISVNDLATKFFNSGNVDEKANKPVISIDNTEILESISGVKIGALSVGADVTGGFLAMPPIQKSKRKIILVFKDFNAKFLRRAESDVHFLCKDGQAVSDLVDKAIETGERQNYQLTITATTPNISDEIVAEFALTLSIKDYTNT